MARPSDFVTCKHCRKDFRAITVTHLRKAHRYKGEHPILDYKRKFRLQSAMCPKSRKKIRVAKEEFWDRRGQHWTTRKVLAEIRRRRRSDRSLRKRDVPVALYEAGNRLFGSWQAAVQKAGFNYERFRGTRRWTPEKIIEDIQALACNGVPMNRTHIKQRYPYLQRAASRAFPHGWAKALQAAGLDPGEHKKFPGRWDHLKATEWVKVRIKKGRSLLARDTPDDLLGFVWNRLETNWTAFVESFGVAYPGIKKRRDWTKKKVLEEIRRLSVEGHEMNYSAMKSGCGGLLHQAKKYFGSWDAARAAAGV